MQKNVTRDRFWINCVRRHDSTLQAKIIDDIKKQSSVVLSFDNDKITKNIDKFNNYITEKIKKIHVSPEIYQKNIQKCYQITCSPLQTHDLPGRFIISEYFKRKKLKVFFSADGCDELFFGQQIYLDCFESSVYKKNNLLTVPILIISLVLS